MCIRDSTSLWKPRGWGALSEHVLGTVKAQIYRVGLLPAVTNIIAVVIAGIAAVTATDHAIPIAGKDVVIIIAAVTAADQIPVAGKDVVIIIVTVVTADHGVSVVVKVVVFIIAAGDRTRGQSVR